MASGRKLSPGHSSLFARSESNEARGRVSDNLNLAGGRLCSRGYFLSRQIQIIGHLTPDCARLRRRLLIDFGACSAGRKNKDVRSGNKLAMLSQWFRSSRTSLDFLLEVMT